MLTGCPAGVEAGTYKGAVQVLRKCHWARANYVSMSDFVNLYTMGEHLYSTVLSGCQLLMGTPLARAQH